MKRFIISLILGGCLIGAGIVVSIYEFSSWSDIPVSIYEMGYQQGATEYKFTLSGNQLVLNHWLSEQYEIEIVYKENLENNVIVTVMYPKDLYSIYCGFENNRLIMEHYQHRQIRNSINIALKVLEKKRYVEDYENLIKIVIQVDPSIQIIYSE